MYGKLLNTIINIIFITYLLLLVSFYFLHEGIKENINNINYTTVDTVSTTGVFNVDVYNNLKEKVFAYAGADCNYTLTIKYQKKKAPGVFETSFLKDTITAGNLTYPIKGVAPATLKDTSEINAIEHETDAEYRARCKKIDPSEIITINNRAPHPMYKGDIITIYLEDNNQTLYGKLITTPFMGMLDNYVDFRIKSLKISMIGRDANKLVNGYEVIDDINDPNRQYTIYLVSEMSTQANMGGKTFTPTQRYSDSDADSQGITTGGTSTVGTYHIFSTVNYYRVWEDAGISGSPNGSEDAGDSVTYYQTTNE
ncbi:MAG: hypothetical protein MJ232_04680 [archaeon]|nr:hypothetical protein [archaeon]